MPQMDRLLARERLLGEAHSKDVLTGDGDSGLQWMPRACRELEGVARCERDDRLELASHLLAKRPRSVASRAPMSRTRTWTSRRSRRARSA